MVGKKLRLRLKGKVHKKLTGISILNGVVMDGAQSGIAGPDKWLCTNIAPIKNAQAACVCHLKTTREIVLTKPDFI